MELGFVGLGRMGLNMVIRLQRDRHRVVTYDRTPDIVKQSVQEGAVGATSLKDLVSQLTPRRHGSRPRRQRPRVHPGLRRD